jgi:hypothetical protein
MADIRTITQELSISGSLSEVQLTIESSTMDSHTQETVQFLSKKIDELIEEVNTLKNA